MVIVFLFAFLALSTCAVAGDWDVMSDTWVATDALGRELPSYEECGPPREGKTVGIFYFTWLGGHGTGGPYDITTILAQNPDNPKWGPNQAFHHWGESELGYYLSKDSYVIRKHAQMLADAGVDTLIIDVTNAFTYDEEVLALCKTFKEVRDSGGRTPQICFITNSASDSVVQKLYDNFYSKSLYPELWFRWKGKPLMLANPDNLSQRLKDFFTFRQSWAWHDPKDWFKDGQDKWPWLDYYPQAYGWHESKDKAEEVAVGVAQHPMTNVGRSYHNGKEPAPEDRKPEAGLYFEEQWKRVWEVDPEFVYITGWNEWAAQRFIADRERNFTGKKIKPGDSYYVDTYSQEYSRDIEPMKGGHTDNYYYQMIANIRKYKGVRKPEPSSLPKTIKVDGNFEDWVDVRPEYRDYIGDTEHRDSQGWGDAGRYVNNTGRNDFVRSKVTYDNEFVYFYVETRGDITSYKDPNWMLLFIDSDQDSSTGWNGYDLLVNSLVINKDRSTLKRTGGGWNWKAVRHISYAVSGNKLELAIPRVELGCARTPPALDFHWADNIQKPDDIIEFSISGDSAPSRRFNYRFSAE